MRTDSAVFLFAVALAHCGHSNQSATSGPASAAWQVHIAGGGSCELTSSSVQFGDSSISATAVDQRVTDEEIVQSVGQTASVSCAVVPVSGGGFQVQVRTVIGSDTLNVQIAQVDASATMTSPTTGTVTYASSATVNPYTGTCNFYFADPSEGVASGDFWAAFSCSTLTAGPQSSCAVSESYLAVMGCDNKPIF